MVLVNPNRILTLNLKTYTPAPEIAAATPRFLGRTRLMGDHRLWTGHPFSGRKPPTTQVGRCIFTIFDFAYLALVDHIWPYLKATPSCNESLCVAPTHLQLARAGRLPHPELTETDWDDLALRLLLTGDRKSHRHLRTHVDIAQAYGVDPARADYELGRRNAKSAWQYSTTIDATRHAES